ncbi:AMIN-like domain-containing (lipo)protein [Nesterenkonia halobia]|uniref:AMIN-like domain-containing protein n=1 Tax=Nesterenkonia halobia TaxID=37922 RepID=A0ABP6RE57_9MICC
MDTTTHGRRPPTAGLPRHLRPTARRRTRRAGTVAALLLALSVAGCGAPETGPTGVGDTTATGATAGDAPSDASSETSSDAAEAAEAAEAGPSDDGAPSGVGDVDVDSFTVEAKQSPQFPGSVDPVGEGEQLLLHTVRVGSHPEFDRAVFEHAGDGMPAWRVEYVARPTQPGSGGAVDMPGEAFIAVHAQGLMPGNAGEEAGHRVGARDWTHASSIIRSTYSTVVFEGSSTYYLGLDRERPFEVRALEEPSRLVLDVKA